MPKSLKCSLFYNEEGSYTICFGESTEHETIIHITTSKAEAKRMVSSLNKSLRFYYNVVSKESNEILDDAKEALFLLRDYKRFHKITAFLTKRKTDK
jgi:hypothetical protein